MSPWKAGVPGMDPASQELQFRGVGVPLANIHRDVGVSGTIGTQVRQGWHQLDVRLAGGETLVVVAESALAYCGDMTTWSVAGGTSPSASLSM